MKLLKEYNTGSLVEEYDKFINYHFDIDEDIDITELNSEEYTMDFQIGNNIYTLEIVGGNVLLVIDDEEHNISDPQLLYLYLSNENPRYVKNKIRFGERLPSDVPIHISNSSIEAYNQRMVETLLNRIKGKLLSENNMFKPRNLGSRYEKLNSEQPEKKINGKIIKINQYDSEGNKDGYWEDYYSDGGVYSQGNFKNNYQDGEWKYYYGDGTLWVIGNFINGNKEGHWKKYGFPEGRLINSSYENGKLVTKKSLKESNNMFKPRNLEGREEQYKKIVDEKFVNGFQDELTEYIIEWFPEEVDFNEWLCDEENICDKETDDDLNDSIYNSLPIYIDLDHFIQTKTDLGDYWEKLYDTYLYKSLEKLRYI
jgi:antitoxin component YwqK of YwqJK toxin-antitoxin module